jgi:uncharacterized protein (DUF2132 family)
MIDNKHKGFFHGVTLQMIPKYLVKKYGWEELSLGTKINCLKRPQYKVQLGVFEANPWARKKVESLYGKS